MTRFRLRHAHVEAMDAAADERLEVRVLAHVRRCFPEEVAGRDDEELRAAIGLALERARSWGFEVDLHLCQFVDLSVVLGGGFDADPRFSWAGEVLRDPAIPDATLRMSTLWARALRELPRLETAGRGPR